MPTYEYRCQDCGATVEVVQSFKDEPLTVCGVCGGRLRRVFHPVGIVLKGSGFYSTDNRSGRKPATPKPADGAKPDATTDATPSKETKESKDSKPAGKKDGGSSAAAS